MNNLRARIVGLIAAMVCAAALLCALSAPTKAAPGERTTGTGAQTFAVTGPGWQGLLPPGMDEIKSPTAMVMLIGRTQTNG